MSTTESWNSSTRRPLRDLSRWSAVEIMAMAKHEIKTVEAIKKKRPTAEYKELIESLKTEGTIMRDIEEQVEEEAAAALPGPTVELVEESSNQVRRAWRPRSHQTVRVESPTVNTCPIDIFATSDPVRQYLATYFELTEGWSDEDRALYDLSIRSSVKNSKNIVLEGLEKWLRHVLDVRTTSSESQEAKAAIGEVRIGLAEHILDDKPLDSAQIYPPIENIEARYNEIFGTESPEDNHPVLDYINHSVETYLPFTEHEIVRGLADKKSQAAGPDHLRPTHLRRLHPRAQRRPISVVALDLRKAFDTVSHNSIARALRRFQVDDRTTRLIGEQYRGTFTKVSGGGTTTAPVDINIGTKQGDPLSPILFNMVLDELIVKLEGMGGGVSVGDGKEVTVLGYADDLILFANDHRGASKLRRNSSGREDCL
ncbi:hypothetical protein Trydic_g13260 [Trypoxylus dichotomus]